MYKPLLIMISRFPSFNFYTLIYLKSKITKRWREKHRQRKRNLSPSCSPPKWWQRSEVGQPEARCESFTQVYHVGAEAQGLVHLPLIFQVL